MTTLPRVLYLTHRVPYPPDKGDRIRNYHLLRGLARRARVWLGCLADEPVSAEARAELDRLCEWVAIRPVGGKSRWLRAALSVATGGSVSEGVFANPVLAKYVFQWSVEVDFAAVVVSASSMAPYLRDFDLGGVPRFVDLVDVDSQKWHDFADATRGPKRWLYRLEATRVRKLERRLPEWTEAVAVVSRAEADVFDSFTRPGAATVAANGVDLDYFAPRSVPIEPALVFVGAMDYLPNVDGAVWFAREVWPAIRAKHPAAEFRVVGRKPTPEVQRLAELPGVKVLGTVPDVRPFVASAAAAVVPLRLARGIQNKVLEALAMARPVVAAPPALAALGTVPGEHLLRAATSAEWVEACCGLLADPARGTELGAAGRRYVEAHHHWETCLDPFLRRIIPADAARH
ncbi:TIGR03087 family PEP-CTERM/XrtA system glycosyltransferase [bacterium]|nr:TIGR03087 family PEP-CTERM/XrtA system glycosyltransferase [bacterium]